MSGRRAVSADSALPSCTKPMMALTTTAMSSTPVSTQCSSNAVMSADPSITYSKMLWNWSTKRSSGPRWRGGARRLGPWVAKRTLASVSLSPWGPVRRASSV